MENRAPSITYYMNKCRPYSLDQWERDARKLILNRQEEIRSGSDPMDGISEYGAAWSILTRKRRIGVLIFMLYTVAVQEKLDMTSTLAQRLLRGWTGRGIRNQILFEPFAVTGRTAGDKSADLERVDELVEKYRQQAINALEMDKKRQAALKRQLLQELGDPRFLV